MHLKHSLSFVILSWIAFSTNYSKSVDVGIKIGGKTTTQNVNNIINKGSLGSMTPGELDSQEQQMVDNFNKANQNNNNSNGNIPNNTNNFNGNSSNGTSDWKKNNAVTKKICDDDNDDKDDKGKKNKKLRKLRK